MVTPYETVYGRFLSKIRDYPLLEEMTKENGKEFVKSVMNDYLLSAIANFTYKTSRIKERDDKNKEFKNTLNDTEIEILAKFMLVAYLTPIIVSSDKIEYNLTSKDFRSWSPGNLIAQIGEIKRREEDGADWLMIQNYYRGDSE